MASSWFSFFSYHNDARSNTHQKLSFYLYLYELKNVLLTQYCSGDIIEKNEMDGVSSAYGGEKRRIQGFGEAT